MTNYSRGASKGLVFFSVLLNLMLAAFGFWRWQLGEGYGLWVLLIFAALALLFASAVLKCCMWLAADTDGLVIHYWFSRAQIAWQDIETLGLVYHHVFPSVGLKLTEQGKARWPGRIYDREHMQVDAVLPAWLAPRAERVLQALLQYQHQDEALQ